MKRFSVREAADELGVSPQTVYGLCARKRIRHERQGLGGGKIVITDDALEEYRRSVTVRVEQRTDPPPPTPRVKLKHLRL
jgi:excisionase family DNA binding protein